MYFLTGLLIDDQGVQGVLCVGFSEDFTQLAEWMHYDKKQDFDEFNYFVIEKISEGILVSATREEWWFEKTGGGEYDVGSKPDSIKNVTKFAIA